MTKTGPELGAVTAEDFQPHVGKTFSVAASAETEPATTLTLVSAQQRGSAPEGFRAPFSLLFEGPAAVPLEQQTVWIEHPDFGGLSLFIVPIGQQGEKREYQAVFN